MSAPQESSSLWLQVNKRENNFLSKEDLEFWNQKPPQEVILATGSIRKALMFSYQLYGFQFPGLNEGEVSKEPFELETFFGKHIFNGNGALEEKTLLGYLHGVSVYAQPSDGETSSNEPYPEAVNKVQALADDYADQDVLIISTDTVDQPKGSQPLGKPMNELGFPKKGGFTLIKDYEDAVTAYLEQYKITHYSLVEAMIHTNAIAVFDALNNQLIELDEKTTELRVDVEEHLLETAMIKPDVGGGGMTQQLIEWGGDTKFLSYMDELMKKEMLGQEDSVVLWALYCQIAGMPFYAVKRQLQEANKVRSSSKS